MGIRSTLRSWFRPAKTAEPPPSVQTVLLADGGPAPMTPENERLLRWAKKLAAEHPEAASLTANGQPTAMTPELAEMIRKALEQSEEPPAV